MEQPGPAAGGERRPVVSAPGNAAQSPTPAKLGIGPWADPGRAPASGSGTLLAQTCGQVGRARGGGAGLPGGVPESLRPEAAGLLVTPECGAVASGCPVSGPLGAAPAGAGR
jgi:hypothetical protein